MSLEPLIASRRVILCVGCGGVGKTTTAAAIGLLGAAAGKRTLCLTINPARRLAESLGYSRMTTEEQQVDPERLREAGVTLAGELTVMMLDTKRTLRRSHRALRLVAGGPRSNPPATSFTVHLDLARGHPRVHGDGKALRHQARRRWDLIVVDTPPTSNALDFLDAPERMIDAIDSPFLRWLATAFQSSGRLSVSLLARGAAAALRGMSRLTGQGFLEALASGDPDQRAVWGVSGSGRRGS